ncbi:MAG: DNA primase, partial [Clostridia bacterium]|nr:DNA primase [Clostridia bacterium]
MRFDESFIEKLKEKNDIVSVVGKYCTLKKQGSSYWACCPLPGHSEKTPSFSINENGQFFKCFGCGRGGDVIKFVMTMENLDFQGAVKMLAEQSGIPLPEDDGDYERAAKNRSERDRLLSLMKTAALFYVHNLNSPEAEPHRRYLEGRGIDRRTITAFGIGASTDFSSLPEHLRKSGFTDEEMLKCGVCQQKTHDDGTKGKVYDALFGRLIIPIINNLGNVIAFGGRLLEKKPTFAKYKNTQETELFIKNRTLYNINNLKKERARTGGLSEIIIVEGYMDTISVYQGGFKNVVASMGTSLTVEQARMLKRYAGTVIISYDGDGAGQKATIRGLEILRNEGLNVRILQLPDGLDPDDVIKKFGAEKYGELIRESIPLVDFKLKNLMRDYDLKDVSDKRKYIAEALKIIALCEMESEREDLLRKLGNDTGTTYQSLRRDLDRLDGNEPTLKQETIPKQPQSVDDGLKNAERFVLCAMLFGKPYAKKFNLLSVDFTDDVHTKLTEIISDSLAEGKEIFPASVSGLMNDDELDEYNAVLSSGDNVFGTAAEERYFQDCTSLLLNARLNSDLEALKKLFAEETDTEKRKNIAKMMADLNARIKR